MHVLHASSACALVLHQLSTQLCSLMLDGLTSRGVASNAPAVGRTEQCACTLYSEPV